MAGVCASCSYFPVNLMLQEQEPYYLQLWPQHGLRAAATWTTCLLCVVVNGLNPLSPSCPDGWTLALGQHRPSIFAYSPG